MALASGISPRELEAIADEDPATFGALHRGVSEKWGTVEELLAGILELTHANYRAILAGNGVKKSDLPEPLKVPRPDSWDVRSKKKKTKAADSSEFASWITARRS